MKIRLFLSITATGLLLASTLFSCGEDSTKNETENPPFSTDDGSTDSDPTQTADAGDSETGTENLSCETLSLCEPDTDGAAFTCPENAASGRSCKRLPSCGDTPVCAADEEACLLACGRVDCAILDTDPEWIQCPDQ